MKGFMKMKRRERRDGGKGMGEKGWGTRDGVKMDGGKGMGEKRKRRSRNGKGMSKMKEDV